MASKEQTGRQERKEGLVGESISANVSENKERDSLQSAGIRERSFGEECKENVNKGSREDKGTTARCRHSNDEGDEMKKKREHSIKVGGKAENVKRTEVVEKEMKTGFKQRHGIQDGFKANESAKTTGKSGRKVPKKMYHKSEENLFRPDKKIGKRIQKVSPSRKRSKSVPRREREKVNTGTGTDTGHELEDIIVTFGRGESQGYFIARAADDSKRPDRRARKEQEKDGRKDESQSVPSKEGNMNVNEPERESEKNKQAIRKSRRSFPRMKNSDSSDGGVNGSAAAKPSSAGASLREGALRVLQLCQKGEWPPMDQVLKGLEKTVAAGGEDINSSPLAGIIDVASGMTPLMFAVKENRTSFVDRMIDLGCDITARNNDNFNALHIASMFSREDVVKLLLAKKGVDVYAPGGVRQQTAVHLVASRQTGTATSILRVLLAAAGKEIRIRTDGDPPRMDEGHSNLLTTESTSEPDTGIGVPHPNNGTDSEFEHKDRDEESPQMVIDDEILERKRKRAEYNRKYAAKKKLLNVKNSEVEDKQKHAEDQKMKRVEYNRNYITTNNTEV